MIWAALIVGVLAGILFMIALDAVTLGPVHRTFDELEKENGDLKKQVATLQAQLEALEQLTADQEAF